MSHLPRGHFIRRGRTALRMMSVPGRRMAALVALAVVLAVLQGLAAGMLSPILQFIEFGKINGGIFGTLLLDLCNAFGLPVGYDPRNIMLMVGMLVRI